MSNKNDIDGIELLDHSDFVDWVSPSGNLEKIQETAGGRYLARLRMGLFQVQKRAHDLEQGLGEGRKVLFGNDVPEQVKVLSDLELAAGYCLGLGLGEEVDQEKVTSLVQPAAADTMYQEPICRLADAVETEKSRVDVARFLRNIVLNNLPKRANPALERNLRDYGTVEEDTSRVGELLSAGGINTVIFDEGVSYKSISCIQQLIGQQQEQGYKLVLYAPFKKDGEADVQFLEFMDDSLKLDAVITKKDMGRSAGYDQRSFKAVAFHLKKSFKELRAPGVSARGTTLYMSSDKKAHEAALDAGLRSLYFEVK